MQGSGRYELIGRTRDVRLVGGDKVARLLGPGTERPHHRPTREGGNDRAYRSQSHPNDPRRRNQPKATAPSGLLPPDLERSVDSFRAQDSGHAPDGRERRSGREREGRGGRRPAPRDPSLGPRGRRRAASFQRGVEALLDGRSRPRAGSGAQPRDYGGVGEHRLRAEPKRGAGGLPVFVPPLSLSTDNAAMIGAAGLRRSGRRHSGLGPQRRASLLYRFPNFHISTFQIHEGVPTTSG